MSYSDQKNKKTIVLPTLEQTKIPGIIILSYWSYLVIYFNSSVDNNKECFEIVLSNLQSEYV